MNDLDLSIRPISDDRPSSTDLVIHLVVSVNILFRLFLFVFPGDLKYFRIYYNEDSSTRGVPHRFAQGAYMAFFRPGFATTPHRSEQMLAERALGRPHPQGFSGVEQRWRKLRKLLVFEVVRWIAWYWNLRIRLFVEVSGSQAIPLA